MELDRCFGRRGKVFIEELGFSYLRRYDIPKVILVLVFVNYEDIIRVNTRVTT